MRISVEFGFSFKRELDEAYRTLDLPDGATVRDAMVALGRRYSTIERRLFDEDGAIRRNINALINGGNVQFRERFDTVLSDGDRLTILPPVGGG
jgi:molybdopterin synthase sulfur carrier subunit